MFTLKDEKVMILPIMSQYRLPIIFAAVGHFVLVSLLFVSFPKSHSWRTNAPQQAQTVVKATAIDSQLVEQQINAIHAQEAKQQQIEQQRLQAIKHQAALAAKKRQQEEARLQDLKKAQQKLKQQAAQQEKEAAAQKALALKKQKQLQLEKKQEALQEALLKEQLEAERNELLAQQKTLQAQQLQGQVDKYRAQILQAIQNNWHPSQQNKTLFCTLIAHLAPGGVVTSVDVVQSSGDVALDRSAETAVYKSSPLPVPKETALFDAFRQLRIKMSPQEVK